MLAYLLLTICLLFPYLIIAETVLGEIITCRACRLNKLPEVKRFVMQPGHADAYENLTINFILGRSPELFIKKPDGTIIEKVDLSTYTCEGIHELLIQKGFKRKTIGTTSSGSSNLRIS